MVSAVEFTVIGRPQPAGSKRGIPIYRKGRQFTGRVATIDTNEDKVKPWRGEIVAAAREALAGRAPLEGPISLEVDFYVARPAGHFGTGRNHHLVKASAPRYPCARPDTTKLLRAVEDAMTDAGVWRDDAQVVTQTARKLFGRPERAEVRVRPT
jgi:Holliday junction resolvase RusA-like endonuclease